MQPGSPRHKRNLWCSAEPVRQPRHIASQPLQYHAGTQQQRAGQASPAATAPGADASDDADQLDVSVSVKDSGMRLVTALSHDVRWESGAAEARLFFRASALHLTPRLVSVGPHHPPIAR